MTEVFIDAETMPQQPEEEARAAIAETIQPPASMTKPETIEAWHRGTDKYAGVKEAKIDEQYRETALNGAKGEIMSIAWAFDDDSEPECFIRLPDHEDAPVRDEVELLDLFFGRVADSLQGIRPYFVGHNIGGFDLTFLFQRAVINRVKPPFPLSQHGRHEQHFFDNMQAWAGYRGTISQDNLCKALGIEVDSPADMDGSKVWDAYKAGRFEEIVKYNKADVAKAREIYRRLTFR